jgi:hypothetical protein
MDRSAHAQSTNLHYTPVKENKLLVAICHSFLFICFRFIVLYEDMSIEQTSYIVWLVDVDWMHLEVGLKWAFWLYAEI